MQYISSVIDDGGGSMSIGINNTTKERDMSKEAEDLLIAWRKSFGEREHYGSGSTRQAMFNLADKLIAEREPKIMSASEVCGWREQQGWHSLRDALLANIAAVLDKKLAALSATATAGNNYQSGVEQARRIVADALKVSS